ncbi:ComEC/Rec2 family competence protein [Corynebacterium bovis]
MVVGDVSGQSPTDRQAALATGLSHLTAVSGANVAVVTGAAMALAAVLGLRPAGRVVVAAVALAGFVVLIGPEPSVLRAAVMGVVGLIAVVSARRAHAVAAVSLAVIVLTAVDPGLAVSYGFVLSVVATVGIVSLGRLLGTRFIGCSCLCPCRHADHPRRRAGRGRHRCAPARRLGWSAWRHGHRHEADSRAAAHPAAHRQARLPR